MSPRNRNGAIGVGLVALAFGAWWYLHDPFRSLDGHVVSDNTTLYKADGRLYLNPRRVRTICFKDLSIDKLLSTVKGKYPAPAGWQWKLAGMPRTFEADRPVPGETEPEQVFAAVTSAGTLELEESRVMSPAEVQVVIRSQGSDAFVLNPLAPTPHGRRPDNPRIVFGG